MKTRMFVSVATLKPGDYVIPAQCTVTAVDHFRSLVIVDFADGTATAPINPSEKVEILRREA